MEHLWSSLLNGYLPWDRSSPRRRLARFATEAVGLESDHSPSPIRLATEGSGPGCEPGKAAKSGLRGKKAAMVLFSYYPADPRPRRAADALLKAGMSVDLICLRDESASKRETLNGINVFRLPITHTRGGKLAYAYEYSAFILMSMAILGLRSLRNRYDLVYVNNMPDILVLSSMIPKMLGAKVILDLHDPMPELMMTIFGLDRRSLAVRLMARLEKWSIASANLVLTVNIACKRIFSSRSCPSEKIGIVMNSPDEDVFPLESQPLRARTNQTANKRFVIMYHGSIVERNGLDLAIDALALVRKRVPAAELRIYGRKTPFLKQVMEEVLSRGLDESVRYLGGKRLEELVQEIADCDVGIIPNHQNAFTEINTPTRIFEYLARGKPVIAPRTSGIQDYFDQESLIFFESGNARDLARKIEFVCSHSDETMEVAKRGQQVYLAHTWSQERETLVSLVSQLLTDEPA
jgi:glycosyltransferase involved in cell wall biosynthesis